MTAPERHRVTGGRDGVGSIAAMPSTVVSGAADEVTEPFEPLDLVTRVEAVLNR